MELVVATRNRDKFTEIKTLLNDLPLQALSLNNFKDVPEVKEDGLTFEANAKKKAIQTSRFLKRLVISDDSGLEVEVLRGKPGVYSARFSGKGATYASNNRKLLGLLKDTPLYKRKAQFRCVIAIADRGKIVGVREGRCKGRIGFKSVGETGFGYDPIFIPYGYKRTFAQLGAYKKNKISHRKRALVKAKKVIKRYCSSQQRSR
ncbi:RdgB/HAM1 family non-canonical purine NTP pyrophosphatase [Candidatus Omnitrophota bacterium]